MINYKETSDRLTFAYKINVILRNIRLVMLQSIEIYENEAIEYDLSSKAEFYI